MLLIEQLFHPIVYIYDILANIVMLLYIMYGMLIYYIVPCNLFSNQSFLPEKQYTHQT